MECVPIVKLFVLTIRSYVELWEFVTTLNSESSNWKDNISFW